jgi:hypothetical protein
LIGHDLRILTHRGNAVMVQEAGISQKIDEAGRLPVTSETRWPCSVVPLSLEERANLARNLYALQDWLKDHLQP